MDMARQPTLVQFTEDLLVLLDQRAATTGRSRSDLIREAVANYLSSDRQAFLDTLVVEGYERLPEPADELGWAEAALRESIAEEPW